MATEQAIIESDWQDALQKVMEIVRAQLETDPESADTLDDTFAATDVDPEGLKRAAYAFDLGIRVMPLFTQFEWHCVLLYMGVMAERQRQARVQSA
jgi:hypothetical protein